MLGREDRPRPIWHHGRTNSSRMASSFQYMKGVYELKDTLKRHDQINSPNQQPS